MSSFFLTSGSAGFLPKHMIAGAMYQRGSLSRAGAVEREEGAIC
jgi:hypothetical protein